MDNDGIGRYSRRAFLKASALAGAASALLLSGVGAVISACVPSGGGYSGYGDPYGNPYGYGRGYGRGYGYGYGYGYGRDYPAWDDDKLGMDTTGTSNPDRWPARRGARLKVDLG